jgi:acetylcholinesterase/cholinesterase
LFGFRFSFEDSNVAACDAQTHTRMITPTIVVALLASFVAGTTILMPDGPVAGSYNPRSGTYSFKGIPYAEPPVGDLRFADTVPVTPWNATRPATEFSAGCMAVCNPDSMPKPLLMCPTTVSEDCLYVNVYTPSVNASGALLPVVFFMHGGNYVGGAGGVPLYDGTELARKANVVVVTINYRLGIFGALYTAAALRGNFMSKDQREAMRWVQRNVGAFGGDKDRVTITGQSAGAFSVAVHLSSPLSKGLFAQAISVSNPIALPASSVADGLRLGAKVVAKLNCSATDAAAQLRCLRSVPAPQAMALCNTLNFDPLDGVLAAVMQWVPVVVAGSDELPLAPVVALAAGKYTRVPVMFGTVANESVQFVRAVATGPMTPLEGDAVIDLTFGLKGAGMVHAQYGAAPASERADVRPFLSYVATDYLFYCANRYVGRTMARLAPTFVYYYSYVSKLNEWMFGQHMPECVHVVCHAQDLGAIFFPFAWLPAAVIAGMPALAASDRHIAEIVQSAWGNFAHGGSPDPLAGVAPGVGFAQFNFSANNVVNYSVPTSNLAGYHTSKCDMFDTIVTPPYTKR